VHWLVEDLLLLFVGYQEMMNFHDFKTKYKRNGHHEILAAAA
jgi:hypothetical protein